jgi:hypothetical protein
MQITRRGLITGLAAFVAAPAIVRVSSLMSVKAVPTPLQDYQAIIDAYWRDSALAARSYGRDLVAAFEHIERNTRIVRDGDGNLMRIDLAA